MTLVKCECGQYFNKYGNIILGEAPNQDNSNQDKICVVKCPHCGKTLTETGFTRKLTAMINGDEDLAPLWDDID